MRLEIRYDGELCRGCTFCCWSLKAQVPALCGQGWIDKPAGQACPWLEPGKGCRIHDQLSRDSICRRYACPWVMLQRPDWALHVRLADGTPVWWLAHRPDAFQELLGEPWVQVRGVMPLVPAAIPVERALALARRTRSILATRAALDPFGVAPIGFEVGCQALAPETDTLAASRAWEQELLSFCMPKAA